jgi:hypothetical protein
MMERYSGEIFRFRFDPKVAYRLNEGMRGHDRDVRRDWRVIVNGLNELVVIAGPMRVVIPRESVARVDYTSESPPNGTPGAWPSAGTFWAVPSLINLVSIQIDPPVEGQYGQGQWADRRGIPKAQVPHINFSTFPPSHRCKVALSFLRAPECSRYQRGACEFGIR